MFCVAQSGVAQSGVAQSENTFDVLLTFFARQLDLRRREARASQNFARWNLEFAPDVSRQQFALIKAALPLSKAMLRNRNDQIDLVGRNTSSARSSTRCSQIVGEKPRQRFRQRGFAVVFEAVNRRTNRAAITVHRTRRIEWRRLVITIIAAIGAKCGGVCAFHRCAATITKWRFIEVRFQSLQGLGARCTK